MKKQFLNIFYSNITDQSPCTTTRILIIYICIQTVIFLFAWIDMHAVAFDADAIDDDGDADGEYEYTVMISKVVVRMGAVHQCVNT